MTITRSKNTPRNLDLSRPDASVLMSFGKLQAAYPGRDFTFIGKTATAHHFQVWGESEGYVVTF